MIRTFPSNQRVKNPDNSSARLIQGRFPGQGAIGEVAYLVFWVVNLGAVAIGVSSEYEYNWSHQRPGLSTCFADQGIRTESECTGPRVAASIWPVDGLVELIYRSDAAEIKHILASRYRRTPNLVSRLYLSYLSESHQCLVLHWKISWH